MSSSYDKLALGKASVLNVEMNAVRSLAESISKEFSVKDDIDIVQVSFKLLAALNEKTDIVKKVLREKAGDDPSENSTNTQKTNDSLEKLVEQRLGDTLLFRIYGKGENNG